MIWRMIVYGPRDAASVLMHKGHKVARIWRGGPGHREYAWKLDGRLLTLAALEDAAERYEKLKNRQTGRKPRRVQLWNRASRSSMTGTG